MLAYYTLKQASEILCISERTIRRRVQEGIIPKSNLTKKILIPSWYIYSHIYGEEINPSDFNDDEFLDIFSEDRYINN
jgi:hypothetical protein